MTRRVSHSGKRVVTDCHHNSPIVSGCSTKHAIVFNDSPILNTPKASDQRRGSQRLKAINAAYKMEDTMSSELHHTSLDNSPYSSKHIQVESINILDGPSISETLKDLRERCKAKKWKSMKSFATSNSDLNHAFLKPKEEEPDLDEPLICLKLKKLNKSSLGRKRRKCSHSQESSQAEGTSGSSHMELDKSSITKEVASKDGPNSTTDGVDENVEVASVKNFLHAGIPELSYAVKCETVETCNAVSSSATIIDSSNDLGQSLTELSQRVCEGEFADGELYSSTGKFLHSYVIDQSSSPATMVQEMESGPVVDVSQSVNKVKNEVIEIDSLESKTTCDISSSSHVEFIAKFSFGEIHGRIDESDSKNEDVTAFTTETAGCIVKEIANEFMETDNCTSFPESCKEHFGEELSIDSSEVCSKLPPLHSESTVPTHCVVNPQLVSETTNIISDVYSGARNFDIAVQKVIYDGIKSHLRNLASAEGCTSVDNNVEPKISMEFDNLGDDVPVPMLSTCSHGSNATAKHSLHGRDFHDFFHASGFSEEAGSLDSLVFKALRGDTWRNSNTDHTNFHIEKSSLVETYEPCSLQHSNAITDSSCCLGDSSEISFKNENLQCSSVAPILNDNVENAVGSAEIDTTEDMPPCPSNMSNLVEGEESSMDNEVESDQSVNMSNLVEGEESSMENELESDQSIEHPPIKLPSNSPIKLLSNRKDLSPMSQEKLRQALNGSELDDTINTRNTDEAKVKLSPEGMRKRLKSSRNGSLQRISKGVLRSHETTDRNCFCGKSSLIDTQAQKAITFSQRQLQDIETIATKLLKGLTSLKNIMMESMDSEACLSSSSKFTPEEVNIAIENTSNLEASTKKWLSMMAKDCNRFCKIMKPTENKGATPVSVRKLPKKITFADEAGGLLCHVRVFEQLPETRIVPKNDG